MDFRALELQHLLIAAFLAGMAYIAFRDWTAFWIPDHATLPLGVLGGIWIAVVKTDVWALHVAAAVFGGLGFTLIAVLYRKLRGRDGLGMGDAKLVAVGGLWVGPKLAWAIALGTGLALVATLVLIALRWRSSSDPIPLGFYLAIGLSVSIFA